MEEEEDPKYFTGQIGVEISPLGGQEEESLSTGFD